MTAAIDCLEEAIAGRIARGDEIPLPGRLRRGTCLVPVPPVMAAKAALYVAFREAGPAKVELARRLGTNEKEIRRMLDPKHPTKLSRLVDALAALDRRVVLEFEDAA